MAWNGSGVFARLYSWVSRAATPATKYIDATSMDAEFDNYKTGLEACLTRNGETLPSANLSMNNFIHTSVGAATALTHYARAGEVQKGTLWKAASPGGTIDAMTGTITPAPTLTAGMFITIIAPGSGSNTVTAPTITLNGGSAVTIKKHQGALVAGDYTAGDSLLILYDGTNAELLNPKFAPSSTTYTLDLSTPTTDATGGAVADFIPFVDASESNASNKVLVSDLFTNVIANVTAKTPIAVADKVLIGDSAASGAAKSATVTTVLAGVTGLTEDTAPDLAADFVLTYDNSATTAKKVLARRIGAGKQTIWIPAGSMNARSDTSGGGPASTTTTATTNKNLWVTKDFDTTTQEYVQFTVAFPKGWNEGTVTFQAFWRAASGSGTVAFSLAGVAISNDDLADVAFGTAVICETDTLIATTDLHVTAESSAVTIAGTPAADDLVLFQVSREVASDSLGVDAQLVGIKLFYTTDTTTDE